jgi:putative ABC transport system permease protein
MKKSFRLSDSKPNPGRDVSDELRFHLEMRTQEFIDQGMSPDEARRAAIAAFGDVRDVESTLRDERAGRVREHQRRDWRHGVAMDVAFALRTLRRSLGFTVSSVLTLAFGIGAAATAFTIVNGVLLRPMPYADPARVVMVWTLGQGLRGPETWPLSAPNYVDIKVWNRSFESFAAFRFWPYTLGSDGGAEPELLAGSRATPELFATLGVRPHLGRGFTAADGVNGGASVAIIGYDLWRRRFGGSPDIIGRQVTLSRERFTIVGVMPRGFAFPRGAELPAGLQFRPRTEVWTPLAFTQQELQQRGTGNLAGVGRLRDGTSFAQARADLSQIARRLATEYPRFFSPQMGLNAVVLKEQAVAPVRRGLVLFMGAVGLVLLIACMNVVNLLLARTAARAREFAVRTALGATRRRVALQLVTENLVLTLGGAALGLVIAVWGSRALLALVPGSLPRADDVAVDARVMVATIIAAVIVAAAFGLAASVHTGSGGLAAGLQGLRATAGLGRRAGRRVLVAAEVALSLVLLVGAGLLAQSFARLQRVAPGFEPDRAMTAGVLMPIGSSFNPGRDGPRWSSFFTEYAERLGRLPGVVAAGGVSSLPLTGAVETTSFAIDGRPRPADDQPGPSADYFVVTPGYFAAMGIPVSSGRTFDSRDRADGAGAILVNEEAARRYWPGESALGKRIVTGFIGANAAQEIVGVVRDSRQLSLDVPVAPAIYMPVTQMPYPFLTFVVRTRGDDPASALPLMRRELKVMDAAIALNEVKSLRMVVDASMARQRFSMIVIGAFAIAALALAMIGLYGVIAYSVAQRTREIGVRMALGALPRDVVRLVVGEGLRVTAAGVIVGLVVAFSAARLLRSLLYDVSATNVGTYVVVALLTAAVAVLASYIPARRATRVSPTTALREG